MTRIVYEYPEDAADGDDFIVDETDISPTTVTIRMKRYRPKRDPRAEQNALALSVADQIVKELSWVRPRPSVLFLLRKAYVAVRP